MKHPNLIIMYESDTKPRLHDKQNVNIKPKERDVKITNFRQRNDSIKQ